MATATVAAEQCLALGFRAPRLVATGTPFLGSAFGFGVRSAFGAIRAGGDGPMKPSPTIQTPMTG